MRYDNLATNESIKKTSESLNGKGYEVFLVETKNEALEKIKELIPKSSSVMNGASKTLEQIGFIDFLKSGNHGWNNLHEAIVNEKDPEKQSLLRKQAELSDYYLGSVHALTEEGDFVVASNTGSQLPHIVFTSPNLIFVIGTQKIVKSMDEAFKRLESYVVPLEDKHMQEKYGRGTHLNKIVISKGESPYLGRKIRMILVKEKLGF